jgi:hypothetical protein
MMPVVDQLYTIVMVFAVLELQEPYVLKQMSVVNVIMTLAMIVFLIVLTLRRSVMAPGMMLNVGVELH